MKRSEPRTDDHENRDDRYFCKTICKRWRETFGFLSVMALPNLATAAGHFDANGAEILSRRQPSARPNAARLALPSRRSKKFFGRRDSHLLPHQAGQPDLVSALTGGADNCPGAAVPAGRYTAAAPFTDSGDTTGANDTITSLYYGYYSLLQVNGQDHVYTFTLTSRGPSPEIRVTTPSSSYDPAIYIIDGSFTGACPASISGGHYFLAHANRAGTSGAEVLGRNELNSLPLNVPLHLFIDSPAANNAGPYTLTMKDVTVAAPATRRKFDFDRDGKANISLFRPSTASWYITRSQVLGSIFPPQFSTVQFGLTTDVIVPEDYDGDGTTDIAVYRDGIWYWINSSDQSFNAFPFGLPADIPQPADYDGDGRAELAVFRSGLWYTFNLSNGQSTAFQFGLAGDKPVAADYDADGRADYAVFRNGIWYLQGSTIGPYGSQWGLATDILVPADYDGDDRTDLAVFRDGTWYIQGVQPFSPRPASVQFQFGSPGDSPVPADYQGNGLVQIAVFRQGTWYVRTRSNSIPFITFRLGLANDRPIPAAYQH